jgi:hypothetical protein
MLDDIINGDPMIRLIRRAVNADLEIDFTVNQSDCISANVASDPVIKYARVDPASLPRTVELQYISFDREFAVNTQYARNDAAKAQQNIYSASIDFVLDDDAARNMAYDLLWRIWRQQLSISFTHPDLTIEPADIVQLNTEQGQFVLQVLTSMITKEPNDTQDIGRVNQITGQQLLIVRGASVPGGSVSKGTTTGNSNVMAGATVVGVGDPPTPSSAVVAGATVVGVGGT